MPHNQRMAYKDRSTGITTRIIARRPEGQPTRGKTAPNRLRRVDSFLLMYDGCLLRRTDGDFGHAFYVDLGFGAEPVTTLESVQRFRQLNPALPVLGIEIDRERVTAALPFANALTHFRLGGFNLPLLRQPSGKLETVRLIRVFNVLRQYEESAVADAYRRLGSYLLPGGLLIEGTSDPTGRIWVANLLRKPERGELDAPLQTEALVFSTNFRDGFDPAIFQTRLPKNYIHRVVPGELIYDFFQAWKQATLETMPFQAWGPRQWFMASAQALAARGYTLVLQRKWLRKGYLLWKPSG
ncbi:hypothetical protein BH10CHL1_BH10CHL1_50790 [soil metagenome]